MKKITIIALAMLSIAALSCTKEQAQEAAKSDACKLTSFVATNGTATLDAFIDQSTKTIELSYMPSEYEWLSNATAEVKISDLATISPDPTVAMDYTKGASFTVTAEDGKTTATYTVKLAAAEFTMQTEQLWTKKERSMGLGTTSWRQQPSVAFSGTDIVFQSTAVCDLEGNVIGNLNVDGLDFSGNDGMIGTLANDENGVLIAFANDAENTTIAAWKDGWANAPSILLVKEGTLVDGSFTGDVNGDCIINYRTGYSPEGEGYQEHVVLAVKGGDYENATEHIVRIPFECYNCGNWAQVISFATADIATSPFVVWRGYDPGTFDPEKAEGYGDAFYVFPNANSTELTDALFLNGSLNWDNSEEPGYCGYGNYTGGHVRAFRYNGQNYCAIASTGWAAGYFTIQKIDNLSEDEEGTVMEFLMETTVIENTAWSGTIRDFFVASSFVKDPDSDDAYLIYYAPAQVATLFKIGTVRM